MSGPTAETALRRATALSYVCHNHGDLVALLGNNSASLQGISDAVGSGTLEPAALALLLDTLHSEVQRAGDPLGVYQTADRGLLPAGLENLEVVYRCPSQVCIGRSAHEVGEVMPTCALLPAGRALVRERLL